MRFESHCHFFTAGSRGGYAIKTPSFEVEGGGCRQRPPSILEFGRSCSDIVVLTTSLTPTPRFRRKPLVTKTRENA